MELLEALLPEDMQKEWSALWITRVKWSSPWTAAEQGRGLARAEVGAGSSLAGPVRVMTWNKQKRILKRTPDRSRPPREPPEQ